MKERKEGTQTKVVCVLKASINAQVKFRKWGRVFILNSKGGRLRGALGKGVN